MTRYIRLLFVIYLISNQISFSFAQCTVIHQDAVDIVAQSSIIVEGTVESQLTTWDKAHKMIYTLSTIAVNRVVYGSASKKIIIATQGGIVGLNRIDVNPELKLSQGQSGIFCLQKANYPHQISKLKLYQASASFQSFFYYDYLNGHATNGHDVFSLKEDAAARYFSELKHQSIKKLGGENLLVSNIKHDDSRAINTFSPTTIIAGAKNILTINGSGFGTTKGNVWFKNADYGGTAESPAESYEITSWTDTQIKVEVPSFAGTGTIKVVTSANVSMISSSTLTIPGAQINIGYNNLSYLIRHASETGVGKFVINMNNNIYSNTAAKDAFQRAMTTWSCNVGMNWEVSASTSSLTVEADDNVNLVAFTSAIANGTLAITYSYYVGCPIGANIFWYCTEFDMMIRATPATSTTWHYATSAPPSNTYDFETVMAHELGHAMQLGHIIDATKTMHYSVPNGTAIRTPSPIEISTAADIYTRSTSTSNLCSGIVAFTSVPNSVTVSNTNASGAGSLSQALLDICPNGTISFSLPATSTITLNSELSITKNITINGLGMSTFTLSGNNTNRIFNIGSGVNLSLNNLRLINGFNASNGGALLNAGNLTLQNVGFQNNFQGATPKAFTSLTGSTVNGLSSINIKP